MTENADRDLKHFLKLALAQVRHKIQASDPSGALIRLRLLEELIKEQIPNENSDTATRASR